MHVCVCPCNFSLANVCACVSLCVSVHVSMFCCVSLCCFNILWSLSLFLLFVAHYVVFVRLGSQAGLGTPFFAVQVVTYNQACR